MTDDIRVHSAQGPHTQSATDRAGEYIVAALGAVLPEGVPPPFRAVESAHWSGRGKHRKAVARLTMFDGLPACVEVWNSGGITAHRFTELPGGAVSYEDGRWIRVAEDSPTARRGLDGDEGRQAGVNTNPQTNSRRQADD